VTPWLIVQVVSVFSLCAFAIVYFVFGLSHGLSSTSADIIGAVYVLAACQSLPN
jgi:hypothetical protein